MGRGGATFHLVRHGETRGYTSDCGLTERGIAQSVRSGRGIAADLDDGDVVRMLCADTERAAETATHVRAGLLAALAESGRRCEVGEVSTAAAFGNFQVATPAGLRDVTAAFGLYDHARRHEGDVVGARAWWLVEMDRFWTIQQDGGDPISFWTQVPLLHFEPPASTLRRFWSGMRMLAVEHPGERVVVATHSGPMRALLLSAAGGDPGEPDNAEEVRVRVGDDGTEAEVGYRGRRYPVIVPDTDALPEWWSGP